MEAFLSLRPTNYQTQSTTATPNKSNGGGGVGSALSHLIADVLAGEGEEIDIVSCLSALLIGICVCYNNGAVEDYDRWVGVFAYLLLLCLFIFILLLFQ